MVAAAFAALDRSGEPWVLLRGADDLAQPSGDVDILVAATLLPSLDALMMQAAFHRVLARGRGSHRFYFGYDDLRAAWVKLDVVSDIAFGPFQQWNTPLADGCLERRIRDGALSLPDPVDQAWLALLHLVLDKGEIAPARVGAAQSTAAAAAFDGPIATYVGQRVPTGEAALLVQALRDSRTAELPDITVRLRAAWERSAAGSAVLRAVGNRAGRVLSPTLQGRSFHGLVVAVMGPDGAGKTTLLRGVGADFPVPSKYVYMGMWAAGRWDAQLHRLPGGRLGQKVLRLVRGSATARYHRVRGRLVLLDRVPYDAQLPGSIDTSFGGRVSSALALSLTPQPDLLLVLDAPGEVMFARKGEHSVAVLERWRQAYLQLAERLPGACVLDATEPQDKVLNRGVALVWQRFRVVEKTSSSRPTTARTAA